MSKIEKWSSVITPLLAPNEVAEYAVIGAIGTVSLKDQAVAGVVGAVLTAGMMSMYLMPQQVAFVLTNTRLIMLETDINRFKPHQKIVVELPLGTFSFRSVKSLLLRKYDLLYEDGSEVRITFPMSKKKAGDELVQRIASSSKHIDAKGTA